MPQNVLWRKLQATWGRHQMSGVGGHRVVGKCGRVAVGILDGSFVQGQFVGANGNAVGVIVTHGNGVAVHHGCTAGAAVGGGLGRAEGRRKMGEYRKGLADLEAVGHNRELESGQDLERRNQTSKRRDASSRDVNDGVAGEDIDLPQSVGT